MKFGFALGPYADLWKRVFEFKEIYKWGSANRKKILILRPKWRGLNSVSGEKLHDFEPSYGGVRRQPYSTPPPHTHVILAQLRSYTYMYTHGHLCLKDSLDSCRTALLK